MTQVNPKIIRRLIIAQNRLSKDKLLKIIAKDHNDPSLREKHIVDEFWKRFNKGIYSYNLLNALGYLDQGQTNKIIKWVNSLEI